MLVHGTALENKNEQSRKQPWKAGHNTLRTQHRLQKNKATILKLSCYAQANYVITFKIDISINFILSYSTKDACCEKL